MRIASVGHAVFAAATVTRETSSVIGHRSTVSAPGTKTGTPLSGLRPDLRILFQSPECALVDSMSPSFVSQQQFVWAGGPDDPQTKR